MNHSDEELKRVAKWLGLRKEEMNSHVVYYKDEMYCGSIDSGTFLDWCMSANGRCAIEDKFARHGTSFMQQHFCEGDKEYFVFGPYQAEAIGEGKTPAEAWLSAAIKLTENMNV